MVLRTIGTASVLLLAMGIPALAQSKQASGARKMRVCAAQSAPAWVNWHLSPAGALAEADKAIDELARLLGSQITPVSRQHAQELLSQNQ